MGKCPNVNDIIEPLLYQKGGDYTEKEFDKIWHYVRHSWTNGRFQFESNPPSSFQSKSFWQLRHWNVEERKKTPGILQ